MSSVLLTASKDAQRLQLSILVMSITNHVVQGHKGPQSEKVQKRVASYDKATLVPPKSFGVLAGP
jgi:hypothetical protein